MPVNNKVEKGSVEYYIHLDLLNFRSKARKNRPNIVSTWNLDVHLSLDINLFANRWIRTILVQT